MPRSRWHQVVKWQRNDWIIVRFDPAGHVSCLQRYNRCLRCAQESLHSSTIPTGQRWLLALQLFPNGSAEEEQLWKAGGTLGRGDALSPWIPQCSGCVSLSLCICLRQWCLAAINWEEWLCCEARKSSARDEREHPPSWQAQLQFLGRSQKSNHAVCRAWEGHF